VRARGRGRGCREERRGAVSRLGCAGRAHKKRFFRAMRATSAPPGAAAPRAAAGAEQQARGLAAARGWGAAGLCVTRHVG
jgi:hypothetical protein